MVFRNAKGALITLLPVCVFGCAYVYHWSDGGPTKHDALTKPLIQNRALMQNFTVNLFITDTQCIKEAIHQAIEQTGERFNRLCTK